MDMLHWSVSMLSFLAQPPLRGWSATATGSSGSSGSGRSSRWARYGSPTRRRDAYWQHGSVRDDYSAITCAVMAIGGSTDGYTDAVLRLMEGLDGPRRGVIGPWGHNDTEAGVPGPGAGVLREVVRWYDRWLKGIDNGADEAPMLAAFLQEPDRARGPLRRASGPLGDGADLAVARDVRWRGRSRSPAGA